MSQSRRLAAILAADVAGYSRLMGEDEEGTLARLKAIRRELADPKIKEHHGRIVKTTGDGLLLEFAASSIRCVARLKYSGKWRPTRARARPSYTTGPKSGSPRTRWSGSDCNLADITVATGKMPHWWRVGLLCLKSQAKIALGAGDLSQDDIIKSVKQIVLESYRNGQNAEGCRSCWSRSTTPANSLSM
jgi:hypothetical protein